MRIWVADLCDGTDGINICSTGRLYSDEREKESKDQSQYTFSNIHVEEFCEDGDAEDDTSCETCSPP